MSDKVTISGKDRVNQLKNMYSEVYTIKQLKKKYEVDSVAFGGCLCTNKKEDSLSLFTIIQIGNTKFYCK